LGKPIFFQVKMPHIIPSPNTKIDFNFPAQPTQMASEEDNITQSKFYESLNKMLEICVFSEGKINDDDLLKVADNYKAQYKLIKELLEENKKLKEIGLQIHQNKWYQKQVNPRRRKILTLEEKAKSKCYSNCDYCDNIVKNSYMRQHFLNKCCADNQLKKEFAKKQFPIHIKYNKSAQLANQYIRECLYSKMWNGMYWKYQLLMKYNYKETK